MAAKRIAAVAFLLLAAALVWWATRAEDSPSPPTERGAAPQRRDPTRPSPLQAAATRDTGEGGAAQGVEIRACSDQEADLEVFPDVYGRRDERIPCAPTDRPDTCRTPPLPPGNYVARQWPFWAEFAVGPTGGAPPVAVSCRTECNVRLEVEAADGCTGPGTALLHYRGAGIRGEDRILAEATWDVGTPVLFEGLPCQPLSLAWATAPDCTTQQQEFALDALWQTVHLRLHGTEQFELHVIDAETGAPVADATARCPSCEGGSSDDRGVLVVRGSIVAHDSVTVRRQGYAPHYVYLADKDDAGLIDDDGVIEVALAPTAPAWVQCEAGSAPCPDGTRVWVDRPGLARGHEPCVSEGDGLWTCPVTEGDRVEVSMADGRSAESGIGPGETVRLELPAETASVCLDWAPPTPCGLALTAHHSDRHRASDASTPALAPGRPMVVNAAPGSQYAAELWCEDRGWVGTLTAAPAGAGSCQTVELLHGGTVCTDGLATLSLELDGQVLRDGRAVRRSRQSGCTELVPAGQWKAWFPEGAVTVHGTLEPGGTLELAPE